VSGGSTYRVFRRRAGHGSGEARPWRVGATQAEQGRCRESIEGAGVGKMLRGVSSAGGFLGSSTSSSSSPSSSSPPSTLSSWRQRRNRGEYPRGSRVPRLLLGAPYTRGARLGCVETVVMLGFHATDTRHTADGCGSGARVFGGAWAVTGGQAGRAGVRDGQGMAVSLRCRIVREGARTAASGDKAARRKKGEQGRHA
jgi:hypothetical protein